MLLAYSLARCGCYWGQGWVEDEVRLLVPSWRGQLHPWAIVEHLNSYFCPCSACYPTVPHRKALNCKPLSGAALTAVHSLAARLPARPLACLPASLTT